MAFSFQFVEIRMFLWLYAAEVDFLVWLQAWWIFENPYWQEFWLLCSKLGDPAAIFWFYLPIIHALRPRLTASFVLSGAISEFLNGVFKWLLQGDRPFWWIHESGHYPQLPNLKQYSLTCETGPGSPSGHVMVSAAIWFIVWHYLAVHHRIRPAFKGRHSKARRFKTLFKRFFPFRAWIPRILGPNFWHHPNALKKNVIAIRQYSRVIKQLVYGGWYAGFLILVTISRLYIGTHFPHQVFLGAGIGAAIGYLVVRLDKDELSVVQGVRISALLAFIGLLTFYGLLAVGINPSATIDLAMKYCAKAEWVRLSTTPLSSFVRDLAGLIGLGLAMESRAFTQCHATNETAKRKHLLLYHALRVVLSVGLSLACNYAIALIPVPSRCMIGYYAETFLQTLAVVYVNVALVPYVIMTSLDIVFKENEPDDTKVKTIEIANTEVQVILPKDDKVKTS